MLSMPDLQAILAEASGKSDGGGSSEGSGRVTNKDLGERMDQMEAILSHMANFMGIPLPEGPIVPTETSQIPPEAPLPEESEDPFTPAANMVAEQGMPDPTGGMPMPSGGMPDPAAGPEMGIGGMPKMASHKNAKNRDSLLRTIQQMNNYR